MTKGQKLFNLLVVVLDNNYPHIRNMTVRDACHGAYLVDHFLLHSLLNVMIMVYPEYADKTFSYLQSRAGEMEYKEIKKNEQDLLKRRNEEDGT